MERTREIKNGLKVMAMGLFLAAALVSTGCGQNALLNPTADQVASGANANQAKGVVVDSGSHDPNPGSHDPNP
jgi:hypothetical protein